ncbi:MAG: phage/plasmid primase, P4 family, partial [Euryarchaeota archaeon]|nr:phage/plasmid primase, P4 family [Euryarchaeota archaeon]
MQLNETIKPTFFKERKFLPNEFAIYLLEEGGEHFATPRDTEIVHHYKDGIYHPTGATYIREIVEKAVDGQSITTRVVSEVIGHIQRRTYINPDEFDSDINEITTKNGVLNTKTFEFREHDPKKPSLLQIPVNYDPDADCMRFKKFLHEILPNKIERETIEELFGYCLVRNYSYQKWFMFLGAGANGKGTLLSTLRSLIGATNISAVELQAFDQPFTVAELHGKLANIVGDLSAKELYHSGRLKSLTGGDLIHAEKKFQPPFNFVNFATIIYSANDLPKTFDGTNAFWRRVMLINFGETFSGTTDVKDLWKELSSEEELSGILNLAIKGLQRLRENNQFSKNNSSEEVEEHYIRNSDPMKAFFMDCVDITNATDDYVSLATLHTAFVEYCKSWRFRDTTLRKFNGLV